MQTKILPSRQALVDRIELQFSYGNHFICLISEVGLGKSYLAETFISDKFSEHNKAYVLATRGMTDKHLIGQILEQSFSAPLIDYELSLIDNFKNISGTQTHPLLIVIDNAHLVSDDLAEELFQLSEAYMSNIRILLTSTRQLAVKEAIYMHIEPLNEVESLQLMSMFFKELPYSDEPIFKAFVSEAKGNPQLLLTWKNDNIDEQQVTSKRKFQYKVYLFLVVLVLFIMLLLSMLYNFLPDSNDEVIENNNLPTVINSNLNKQNETPRPVEEVETKKDSSQTTAGYEVNLKTQIQNELQVQAESQTQEEPQTENEPLTQTESLEQTEPQAESELQSQEKPKAEVEPQLQSEIQVSIEPLAQTESQAVMNSGMVVNNDWFLEQNERSYVIQLMVVSDLNVIEQFIEAHQLKNTHIFNLSGEKPLYALTSGLYQSVEQANNAKNQLPSVVQEQGVFAKQIKKIQSQIQP